MVEQALNSRYMQWGAVGVMLALFVWLITRHIPNQEKRREEERKAERESNAEERKQEREVFLAAIKDRDQMYLGTLGEIRRSVETHAQNHQKAKETLSNSVHELALEIRESMK
jgi:chloramphenicol 3-O-phosphotransferase